MEITLWLRAVFSFRPDPSEKALLFIIPSACVLIRPYNTPRTRRPEVEVSEALHVRRTFLVREPRGHPVGPNDRPTTIVRTIKGRAPARRDTYGHPSRDPKS